MGFFCPGVVLVFVLRGILLAYLIQGFFIHDTIQTWPLLWLLAGLALGPLARRGNESTGCRACHGSSFRPAFGK